MDRRTKSTASRRGRMSVRRSWGVTWALQWTLIALLVGQGLNDPRVNVRESDQIVAAMRAKSLAVEYVVYTDEGHGFARQENRLDFYGRAEVFLAKYLGGRAEPFTPVPGASAEVREPVTTPQASAGR